MHFAKHIIFALVIVAFFILVDINPVSADSDQINNSNIWTWWVIDPLAIFGILIAGYLYAKGLHNWRPRSRPVHTWQVISFYSGLAMMVIALISPLDPLADQLFLAHQIQHLLLRVAGPVLIFLGAPLTPVLKGMPVDIRMNIIRPIVSNSLARKAYSWATHPVIIPILFMLVLYIWQFPLAHDAALDNFWVHYFMHLTMTISSMLFWWLIIDPKPHRSSLHYGVRVLIMALTILPNTVLGAFVVFAESAVYNGYGPTRPFNLIPLDDQRWGGLIMWLSADMMTVGTAAIIFGMWFAQEQKQSIKTDRRNRV